MNDLNENDDFIYEDESSNDAQAIAYDDETIIWEGGPSQWINLGTYIWWGIILVFTSMFLLAWNAGLSRNYNELISKSIEYSCYALFVISTVSIIYSFLKIRYEHTVITRNKIKECKGAMRIFGDQFGSELYCEIKDITDIKNPPAGLMGIFGLATVVIETNDDDQPIIRIRAIRGRESLVSTLQPVMRSLTVSRKGYMGG